MAGTQRSCLLLELGAMWWREKAEELMREAGFRSIEVQELPHDFQNYYVCRL